MKRHKWWNTLLVYRLPCVSEVQFDCFELVSVIETRIWIAKLIVCFVDIWTNSDIYIRWIPYVVVVKFCTHFEMYLQVFETPWMSYVPDSHQNSPFQLNLEDWLDLCVENDGMDFFEIVIVILLEYHWIFISNTSSFRCKKLYINSLKIFS